MTFVSKTTGMRRLRDGTRSASGYSMTTHNLNCLFFTPPAPEGCLLHLSIKLLVFPDFEALFHKVFQQTSRIAASLASRLFEAFP